jgi:hypothetical protein
MSDQAGQQGGRAEGEDQPREELREEDVTREDALNDDVREGDEEQLAGGE